MNVLMAGDIVSSPGRRVFSHVVARMKAAGLIDIAIVNGENAAGGRGITRELAKDILRGGADVITLGDHTWNQREVGAFLDSGSSVIRPLNFAPGCPGQGSITLDTKWGRVTVVNLIGRVFMNAQADCPFRAVDKLLSQGDIRGSAVIVDVHAEATSEKVVMGRYLDGRASIVAGTHTHVQTSDELILPKGTAYITDLGMTGVRDSALGRDLTTVTQMFLTGMPSQFKVAQGSPFLEGVLVSLDDRTGRARSIRRIREGIREA